MADLRRVVGVLHSDDEIAEPDVGIASLDALVARICAAGVPTVLTVDGEPDELPASLDLVAYRIVQEALTNVVKHAGPGTVAHVHVRIRGTGIELEITNGPPARADGAALAMGSGHGLVGMRQRVALYAGALEAGATTDGGYRVHARLPRQLPTAVNPERAPAAPMLDAAHRVSRARAAHFDRAVALVWLVLLETEAIVSTRRTGPLVVNMLAVAAMACAAVWRRRSPLTFLAVVGSTALALGGGLTSMRYSTLAGTYVLAVPLYTVGAWQSRRRAVVGLAAWLAGASLGALLWHAPLGGLAGATIMGCIVWTLGRVIHAQRSLTERLTHRVSVARRRARRTRAARGCGRTQPYRSRPARARVVRGRRDAGPGRSRPEPLGRRARGGTGLHRSDRARGPRSAQALTRHPRCPPRRHRAGDARAVDRRSDAMSIRVVIADDQQLVRAGFRMILDTQPDIEVVGEATDGAEAVLVTERTDPDVVLMDIRMPGIDGIEATRRILRAPHTRSARVLILTTFDLDEYVYDALRAGASGFLLKDAPPEQLTSAVRMIAAGDALLAPSITRRLIEQFVAIPIAATPTDVLGGLSRARGRGVPAPRPRPHQPRDRRDARRRRDNGEDARRTNPRRSSTSATACKRSCSRTNPESSSPVRAPPRPRCARPRGRVLSLDKRLRRGAFYKHLLVQLVTCERTDHEQHLDHDHHRRLPRRRRPSPRHPTRSTPRSPTSTRSPHGGRRPAAGPTRARRCAS